jgi:hypothetical protein
MNSPQVALRVASVFAAFICLGHFVRLIIQTEVTIGVYHLSLWPSAVVFLGSGWLSIWFWRLSAQIRKINPAP